MQIIIAEEVTRILQTKLLSSTFNFTGFDDESAMVADLQARESERIGCLRGGAGEEVVCSEVHFYVLK